jgi:hypothetical protein
MRQTWVLVLAVLLAATSARAQGTITDAPVTFIVDPSHFDVTPRAFLTGVATPVAQNQLFESGWWYRVSGDTSETVFPLPDSQIYLGDLATFTWADVDSRGFSAEQVIQVDNAGGPSGSVTDTVTITNVSAGSIGIDLFHMLDPDLAGTFNDDSALAERQRSHRNPDGANTAIPGSGRPRSWCGPTACPATSPAC